MFNYVLTRRFTISPMNKADVYFDVRFSTYTNELTSIKIDKNQSKVGYLVQSMKPSVSKWKFGDFLVDVPGTFSWVDKAQRRFPISSLIKLTTRRGHQREGWNVYLTQDFLHIRPTGCPPEFMVSTNNFVYSGSHVDLPKCRDLDWDNVRVQRHPSTQVEGLSFQIIVYKGFVRVDSVTLVFRVAEGRGPQPLSYTEVDPPPLLKSTSESPGSLLPT